MDAKQAAKVLRDRIDEGKKVLEDQEQFDRWRNKSRITLERIYGPDHAMLKKWDEIRYTLGFWTENTPDSAWRRAREGGIASAIALLEAGVFDHVELATPQDVDPSAFDPDLWGHVAHDVEGEHWDKVPAGVATFVESKVREWAGLGPGDYGKDLMVKVFKPDGGVFPCGDPTV
jgi:hypothetical protein